MFLGTLLDRSLAIPRLIRSARRLAITWIANHYRPALPVARPAIVTKNEPVRSGGRLVCVSDFFSGVVGSTASGVIGLGIGYLGRAGYDRHRRRRKTAAVRELFGSGNARIRVVHSAIFDAGRSAFNYPSSDSRAARHVAHLLEVAGLREGPDFLIQPDIDLPRHANGELAPALWDENLVFLCGPKRNAVLRETIIPVLPPSVRYQLGVDPVTGENVLTDRKREVTLVSSRDAPGSTSNFDYGLIVSVPNPMNAARRLVLLCGVHGTGTLGVAEFISELKNLDKLVNRGESGVIAEVVRADYSHDPDIIDHVELV
jgi:hypothetical protein